MHGYNEETALHLQDTYNILVSEDVPSGVTLGSVFADDRDLGANGNILFQLIEGDSTVFQLNTVRVSGPPGTQRFAGVITNRRVCCKRSFRSLLTILWLFLTLSRHLTMRRLPPTPFKSWQSTLNSLAMKLPSMSPLQ